jgi:hypothetical protein
MNEAELQSFRQGVHLLLLEELLLKTAFAVSQLDGRLSVPQTADALKGWLDSASAAIDWRSGVELRDPAMVALYSDEAKFVTDSMKGQVDRIAAQASKAFD